MPVYTYRCGSCGVQFDQTQKFTDESLTKCPECGKNTLQKVYTPVGIVFKGSGFYATDHRSPSGQSSWASDRKEEKAAETKTDSSNLASTSSSASSSTTSVEKPADKPAKTTETAKPAAAPTVEKS
jgi:putative FmdB family regulatory protein